MEINSYKNLRRHSIHFWIYFFCLCLLVVSMPTSRFLISASQILMGLNWIAEGQFKSKFNKFFSNKAAVVFTLIYGIHILGLFWSEDLHYGFFYDLKHKIPTLTLTLFIVTSPALDIKKTRFVLFLFVATVLAVSFVGFFNFLTKDLSHYRYILPVGSHLYYSMMLILSAVLLPWLTHQITNKKHLIISAYALSLWMIIFLMLIRSLSGIGSLVGVIFFLIIWFVRNYESLFLKISIITLFIIASVVSIVVLFNIYKESTHFVEYDFSKLEKFTDEGNPYRHDTLNFQRENGRLVSIYISDIELEKEWNKRSDIDYHGKTKNNRVLRHVLYNYMTSKGLRKDKEGFKELSEEDIKEIEKGTHNYLYADWPGVFQRIHQTMAGVNIYMETNNPKYSTLAQRIELWDAAIEAIKNKPLIGWGTGDIYLAIQYGLEKNKSKYFQGRDVKPHNQYLLFLITFGIVGFALIVYFYIYTIRKSKGIAFLPFNIFVVIFAVNMLGNNPIDGQFGQTMFVFFTVFFCFVYPKPEKKVH
ncbi:MAG: O-antigen ligase family protein [Bacteroidota bacterium]